jgi:PKD repeat protein
MKTKTLKSKKILGIAVLCLGLNGMAVAQSICNASFTYTVSTTGISTANTSTGTNSLTINNWNLSNIGYSNALSPAFDSIYNGTYVLTLSLSNSDSSNTCSSINSQTITISGGQDAPVCTANFTFTEGSAGSVTFTNTPVTDPYNDTHYSWTFGDVFGGTSGGNPTHVYYYNGTYTITLNVYNSVSNCSVSSTQTISITNAQPFPTCTSNFTYTVGASGLVSFTGLYTGTSPYPSYSWNFGDGNYGRGLSQSHTYTYNGIYSISLNIIDSLAMCESSTTQTISITNTSPAPCVPTVSFYMHKDSLNPQPGVWEIGASYSSQVTVAKWFWGDGSYTTGLNPTHNYATAGQYTVCVRVYSACGDSSTTCQNDSLYRLAHPNSTNSMISVTVLNINATGIKTNVSEATQIALYPNPNAGVFTLQLSNASLTKTQISISNILGEVVYNIQEQLSNNALTKEIDLQNLVNGAYFMQVNMGSYTKTQKIIINK